jgi:rhomboid family GlyGly-CTERM serine protease
MRLASISVTVLLSVCVLVLFGAEGWLAGWQLDVPVGDGVSLPRLLTCHALHWSGSHLVWDLAVFSTLGALCERRSRPRYVAALALSAVLIPLGLAVLHPEITRYRGLSGIDSALFGLLAADLGRQRLSEGDRVGAGVMGLFLLGLAGKIGLECLHGGNLFVADQSFVPLPWAHAIGGVVGVILALGEILTGLFGLVRASPAEVTAKH